MTDALSVATIALQGAAVGVSAELAIRTLNNKSDKMSLQVRLGKFIMGLTMAIKSTVFLSFHASQGEACYITGRVADAFYHIAMAAGTAVLAARVQSIIPVFWQRRTNILHNIIILLRIIIGVVDTALIHISTFGDGSCKYTDEEFWGPVYTLYDTLIDLYVTIMITWILVSHIRALVAERMKINNVVYTSVIYNNVIRTVCLTIVNLISAIFIILQNQGSYIMLLWPIINIFFVVLVGYDSDVTKAIRDLRQKRWRSMSVMTSTIDLTRLSNHNNNNDNRHGCCHHRIHKDETEEETDEDTDEYLDLDLIRLERWKSARTGERRFSLPNLNNSSTTTMET